MNNDKIWSHVSRKLTGEYAPEDSSRFDDWLNEKEVNQKTYDILSEVWEYQSPTKDQHRSLFESIKRRITVLELKPHSGIQYPIWFKVAAVVFVFIVSNFMVYYFSKSSVEEKASVAWHEIVVPRGNRMKILLPDSTSVWLNNETKLRYASNFSSKNRKVELSGEAYFDVHHDAKNPFIVKIGDQQIKVLGTRFTVNAYPEDRIIETSLISGSVIFESDKKVNGESEFRLMPGNSLFYDKSSKRITTQKIQSSFYQYWEYGVYVFTDEKFENLSTKIKRIFNVELVFQDDFLKSKTYTGTISIDDNVFTFMEAIRRTSAEPIEYKFNKNKIYIKLKTEEKKLN